MCVCIVRVSFFVVIGLLFRVSVAVIRVRVSLFGLLRVGVGLGLGLVFWVCIRFIKNTVTVKVGFWGYVRVRVMHGADVHDSDFQKGEKCPGGEMYHIPASCTAPPVDFSPARRLVVCIQRHRYPQTINPNSNPNTDPNNVHPNSNNHNGSPII